MNDLSKNILKQIKGKHIKPKAKCIFIAKRIGLWLVYTLSIILGAIAFSMILTQVIDLDWEMIFRAKKKFELLATFIPYIWILSLIILISASYFLFRNTQNGYKRKTSIIITSSIILSIILGSISYSIKVSNFLERGMRARMPRAHKMLNKRDILWNMVDKGMLGGKVIKPGIKRFTLEDLQQKHWEIMTNSETKILTPEIEVEMMLRILGEKINEDTFTAIEIRPWKRNFDLMKEKIKPPRNR